MKNYRKITTNFSHISEKHIKWAQIQATQSIKISRYINEFDGIPTNTSPTQETL